MCSLFILNKKEISRLYYNEISVSFTAKYQSYGILSVSKICFFIQHMNDGGLIMKRLKAIIPVFFTMFFLTACTSSSLKQELVKHDWILIRESEEQYPPLSVRFDHEKIISKIDTKSFNKKDKDYVGDELAKKFAKQLSNNTDTESRYTINGDEITFKTDQLDIKGVYKMEKDGKDIILTPVDSVENTDTIIKLIPKK